MSRFQGTLNTKRLNRVRPSATLQASQKAKEMIAEGVDVINLSAGEPDFDVPKAILQATHDALDVGATRYTPSRGSNDLLEAISKRIKEDQDISYSKAELIVTPGAKSSLALALDALLGEGDRALIFAPYWVSYFDMIQLAGADVDVVHASAKDAYVPSDAAIRAAVAQEPQVVILNSPANPTGVVWPESKLKVLRDALVESPSTWLISDEIYDKIWFDKAPQSIVSRWPELKERTILVNGASKAYAMTGYRIGYAAGPEAVISGMLKFQQQRHSCATAMAQKGAVLAFQETKAVKSAIETMRLKYQERRDYACTTLDACDALEVIVPEGAFYALVCCKDDYVERIQDGHPSVAAALLQEAHVGSVPGEAFELPNSFRISFAVSDEALRKGVERIVEYCNARS